MRDEDDEVPDSVPANYSFEEVGHIFYKITLNHVIYRIRMTWQYSKSEKGCCVIGF